MCLPEIDRVIEIVKRHVFVVWRLVKLKKQRLLMKTINVEIRLLVSDLYLPEFSDRVGKL